MFIPKLKIIIYCAHGTLLLQFICISLSTPSERLLPVTKSFLLATIKTKKPTKQKNSKPLKFVLVFHNFSLFSFLSPELENYLTNYKCTYLFKVKRICTNPKTDTIIQTMLLVCQNETFAITSQNHPIPLEKYDKHIYRMMLILINFLMAYLVNRCGRVRRQSCGRRCKR